MNTELRGTVQIRREGWYGFQVWIVTKSGAAMCVVAFAREGLAQAGRVMGTSYPAFNRGEIRRVDISRSELAQQLLACRRRGYRLIRYN